MFCQTVKQRCAQATASAADDFGVAFHICNLQMYFLITIVFDIQPIRPSRNCKKILLGLADLMSETRYTHLPLRALVSFEAAARHVSFKAAARELNVPPAAVSHQIKALEAELRTPLFDRHNRGVELTEKGAYLLVAIQRGFDHGGEALDQLKSRARPAAVTIHSTTAVSSLWLTQRLASFWRAHPRIAVNQAVDDMRRDAGSCDLSIHYGDMTLEPAPCRALFRDTITALASPELARDPAIGSVAEPVGLDIAPSFAGGGVWASKHVVHATPSRAMWMKR